MTGKPRRARSDIMYAVHQAKFDKAFTGKTFEIVEEVHLPPGQIFITAFGNRGRHGYIIRNTETGEKLVVGTSVLKLVHEKYLAVPLPRRHRRAMPTDHE